MSMLEVQLLAGTKQNLWLKNCCRRRRYCTSTTKIHCSRDPHAPYRQGIGVPKANQSNDRNPTPAQEGLVQRTTLNRGCGVIANRRLVQEPFLALPIDQICAITAQDSQVQIGQSRRKEQIAPLRDAFSYFGPDNLLRTCSIHSKNIAFKEVSKRPPIFCKLGVAKPNPSIPDEEHLRSRQSRSSQIQSVLYICYYCMEWF